MKREAFEWLRERKRLYFKATPGTWHVQSDGWTLRNTEPEAEARGARVAMTHASGGPVADEVANAELIAALHNDVPAILRLVEAAAIEVAEAEANDVNDENVKAMGAALRELFGMERPEASR